MYICYPSFLRPTHRRLRGSASRSHEDLNDTGGHAATHHVVLIIRTLDAQEDKQLRIAKSGGPQSGPTISPTKTNPPHHRLSRMGGEKKPGRPDNRGGPKHRVRTAQARFATSNWRQANIVNLVLIIRAPEAQEATQLRSCTSRIQADLKVDRQLPRRRPILHATCCP